MAKQIKLQHRVGLQQLGQLRLGLRQGKTDLRQLKPSSCYAGLQLQSSLEAGPSIEPLLLAHQCRTQQVIVGSTLFFQGGGKRQLRDCLRDCVIDQRNLAAPVGQSRPMRIWHIRGRALSATSSSVKAWLRSNPASRSIVAAHWWFIPAIMNQPMA